MRFSIKILEVIILRSGYTIFTKKLNFIIYQKLTVGMIFFHAQLMFDVM